MRTGAAGALMALALVGCVKRQAEFPLHMAQFRRVAILPADIQLVRIVFTGDDEALTAEADGARRELPSSIAAHLESRGFVVRPAHLDDEHVAAGSELRYLTTVARARHGAVMGRLLTGQDSGSLGPDVGGLADHADVDALLFVSLVGFTKSEGQVARDVAVTFLTLGSLVYRTSATRLFVTLVDGTTGRVLWWRWRLREERAFTGTRLQKLVREVLQQMPRLPSAASAPGAEVPVAPSP